MGDFPVTAVPVLAFSHWKAVAAFHLRKAFADEEQGRYNMGVARPSVELGANSKALQTVELEGQAFAGN
jgi:hypothetical protein